MLEICRAIDDDLKWRESELASLKLAIITAKTTSLQTALLRAAWAMLYAHYEGFAKHAWETYLQAVESAGISVNRLAPCLQKLCMEPMIRRALPPQDAAFDKLYAFADGELERIQNSPVRFARRLPTYSNLYPDLFRQNCISIGIRFDRVNRFQTELSLLVERRNGIAHGGSGVVAAVAEYTQHETAVFNVLTELAIGIIDNLEHVRYLRPLHTL